MTTESLFSKVEALELENFSLRIKLQKDHEKLTHFEAENTRLLEILLDLKRNRFGTKSERWESSEQMIFNEVESLAAKVVPAEEDEVEVRAHKKQRGHRRALPLELEREEHLIELPVEERFAEDGTPLKVIGYETSEKLSYEPAKTKVIVIKRAKYGVDSGDYVKTAPPPASMIPKGIATSELLACVVVEKYGYGLPLYRQEYKFDQMGIDLTRQTMARWVVQCAEGCMPVWNILCDRLLESSYVSCDETQTQVLKEPGRKAENKSWMWVRCVPTGKNKIILFDYDPHRSGEVAKRLLESFEGFLQVDGFASYNNLENKVKVVRIGCNMHGRRYFEKALKTGAKSGTCLAEVAMKFYKRLYDEEEVIRSLPAEERHRLRQEIQAPLWAEFKAWADANFSKVPPKSKIGEAFKYFRSEYPYLIGYLRDGRLEMDNGFAERAIRKFAIGRNNWLFADTEAGAHASAMFYSLLITAKVNDVKIYESMKYLFDEIPKAKSVEDYERLADVIMGIRPLP